MSQASVLVVEDNDLERQITADTLRDEGFAVEEAPIGKRALELLALSRFDVVLTDLMMPGMSGEELLAKVKRAIPGDPGGGADRARHDRQRRAGDEERRVLLPDQADRSRGAGDDGRQGLRTLQLAAGEPTPAHADGGQAAGRGDHRAGSGDSGSDQDRAQSRAVEHDGTDPGRERDRQGGHRARDPSDVAARAAPVRRDQLLGDSRQSD